MQPASLQQGLLAGQQAGDAVGCEHHHADEQQAEIELPGVGDVAQPDLQQGDDDRADDRAGEVADSADEGHQDDGAGLRGAELRGVDDLEVDGGEPAGDAGEQARQAEGDEADGLGIVADEGGALGIVAHGVADAAERRAGQGVHRCRRCQAPAGDQVVDLDLRPEREAEHMDEVGAVGADALLAAEDAAQDEGARRHQLADAQRDHGEGGAGPPRRHRAEDDAEGESGRRAGQRQDRQRQRRLAADDGVHRVHGEEAAQAEEDRVAERQQAGLPQQHVVGQGEDDHHPHQAHGGERQSRAQHVRQHRQQRGRRDPDAERGEPPPAAAGRSLMHGQVGRRRACAVAHDSRVPISPLGRKIRIRTSSR